MNKKETYRSNAIAFLDIQIDFECIHLIEKELSVEKLKKDNSYRLKSFQDAKLRNGFKENPSLESKLSGNIISYNTLIRYMENGDSYKSKRKNEAWVTEMIKIMSDIHFIPSLDDYCDYYDFYFQKGLFTAEEIDDTSN